MNTIIDSICNSCSCNKQQAEEYLQDEIRNLRELKALNDLRLSDIETGCDNLGLEHDYVEYFINVLASCYQIPTEYETENNERRMQKTDSQ
jgi:hypothetical protein